MSEPQGERIDLVVAGEDAGTRVDILLARAAEATRAQVAAAAAAGHISVNGRTVKGSTIATEGDALSAVIIRPEAFVVRAEAIPIDVIYEDDTLLVVNKAAGMVTHPAHGSPDGTLVNALLAHTGTLPGEPVRAGLIHRLDRDTSGLLLVAKTAEALTTLGRAMEKRYIKREYLGLVVGRPEDDAGTLDGAIGRDERNRMKYAVRADGKPAITHFTVRDRLQGASELIFRLETGRTHQIRVHLAAYGHPIVNDGVYGRRDRRLSLEGQALHAWRLAFKHPVSKAMLEFEVAPPPAYLEAVDFFS